MSAGLESLVEVAPYASPHGWSPRVNLWPSRIRVDSRLPPPLTTTVVYKVTTAMRGHIVSCIVYTTILPIAVKW